MKKVFIVLGVLLLLVTGCGKEAAGKMVCTRTTNMNNVEMDLRYEVYYEGNNVNKVQSTEKVISEDAETLQTYQEQVKKIYSSFDNVDHYNYDVSIEGDTLTSTTDFDYTKIDMDQLLKIDSSIEQFLNDNGKIDLDKITQVYEQTGATCSKE